MNVIDIAKLKLIENGKAFIEKNPFLTSNIEDLNAKIFEFLEKLNPETISTTITHDQSVYLIIHKGIHEIYIEAYIGEDDGIEAIVGIYADKETVISNFGTHDFVFKIVIDFMANIS